MVVHWSRYNWWCVASKKKLKYKDSEDSETCQSFCRWKRTKSINWVIQWHRIGVVSGGRGEETKANSYQFTEMRKSWVCWSSGAPGLIPSASGVTAVVGFIAIVGVTVAGVTAVGGVTALAGVTVRCCRYHCSYSRRFCCWHLSCGRRSNCNVCHWHRWGS